ncbi:MAG TPA: c-type cytochrome [Gaiellaceae bacterium]
MRSRLLATIVLAVLLAASSASAATGPPAVGAVKAGTGAALYAANCSSCHGPAGKGIAPPGRPGVGNVNGYGPALDDAGALEADFYLRTGYMPLARPNEQPYRSHVLFSDREIRELVAYVAALGHGPTIPKPDPGRGNLAEGFRLFSNHCSGCHQIAAEGGYVTGARVPELGQATDVQIAEAVRTGPYVMPQFSTRAISNAQLDALIRYVDYAKHPDDPGGWSLGRIGPVPEGMVAWLIATAALVATSMAVGRRARHE